MGEVEAFKRCLAKKKMGATKGHLGYDANGDGIVSEAEAACGKLVDVNHNGIIDESETEEFNKCLKQKEMELHHSFHVDFDGNGKVESNEKKFARLFDFNNDGKLGAEELKRAKLAWKLAREEFSPEGKTAAAYDEYNNDDFEDYYDALYGDYDDDEAYGQYTDEQWQQLIDEYYNQYADAFEDYDDELYDDEAYDDNEYDEEYNDEINALQRLLRQQKRMQQQSAYEQY